MITLAPGTAVVLRSPNHYVDYLIMSNKPLSDAACTVLIIQTIHRDKIIKLADGRLLPVPLEYVPRV